MRFICFPKSFEIIVMLVALSSMRIQVYQYRIRANELEKKNN
jgi:Tfp pilus assembly protein PilX